MASTYSSPNAQPYKYIGSIVTRNLDRHPFNSWNLITSQGPFGDPAFGDMQAKFAKDSIEEALESQTGIFDALHSLFHTFCASMIKFLQCGSFASSMCILF
jgi:hypothetical protein